MQSQLSRQSLNHTTTTPLSPNLLSLYKHTAPRTNYNKTIFISKLQESYLKFSSTKIVVKLWSISGIENPQIVNCVSYSESYHKIWKEMQKKTMLYIKTYRELSLEDNKAY